MFDLYKGVLIDIDNTIYDYDRCHVSGVNEVKKYCKDFLKIDSEEFDKHFFASRKKINESLNLTASSHSRILYFQKMCESLKVNPLKHSLNMYNIYWDIFIDEMILFPNVKLFINGIRDKEICFITDFTAMIQFRKLKKLKLDKFVKHIVTSEEAGIEKPHKKIFKLAMSKINCDIKELCMIGDNFDKDIIGATKLGIHTFWFNRNKRKYKPNDLVVEFSKFKTLINLIK